MTLYEAAPDSSVEQSAESAQPDQQLPAIASVPWVAVALAVHAILLMVAWFILPASAPPPPMSVVNATMEQIPDPPPPIQPPEQPVEFPEDKPEETVPVEDQRVQTDDSTHAEDASDSPNKDLSENPNPEESDKESPLPNKDASNSSVGLAGGGGGGDGRGGLGGRFNHRPGPGGGYKHEKEIGPALDWLVDHQNAEGYWSATTFGDDSRRTGAKRTGNVEFLNVGQVGGDTGWEATCDAGLTGLSMLTFTGIGYDHKVGKYSGAMRMAALYLRRIQQNNGCFGDTADEHFAYNHAICTMAIAELYGISGDAILLPILTRAIDFILKMQNPGLGWRYDASPRGHNDSSVTGWMVLTLNTCEKAGAIFDKSKCYEDAAKWFDVVTVDVNGYPKTGYDTPGSQNSRLRSAMDVYDNNPSMDAIYVMSMLFMGKRELNAPDIRSMARVCVESEYLPQWKLGKLDYYYWYYASLALYQVGGPAWDQWEKSMVKTLLDNQRGFSAIDKANGHTTPQALDEHGSWDPVDAWGSVGGRVYSTAINALTLQTYFRYEKLKR